MKPYTGMGTEELRFVRGHHKKIHDPFEERLVNSEIYVETKTHQSVYVYA